MAESTERRWYVVTTVLVAATIGAFLVQRLLPLPALDAVVRMGGLLPVRVSEDGEYFRLVLPLFLHRDLWHLALNLLALVQLGVLVEEFFGSRRALVTYVTTGVAGLLASALLTGVPYVASMGASGAVLGLAGLLSGTMWFGTDPLRSELAALLGRRLTLAVLLTFAYGLGTWMLSDIDNWAHAGGFLAGVCFAFVWSDPPEVEVDDDEEEEDARPEPPPPDEPVYRTIAAVVCAAAVIGAAGWAAARGADALPSLPLETARTLATRVSLQPGAVQNADQLAVMLEKFEQAGAADEGLDTFARGVAAFDEAYPLALLMTELDRASRAGKDRDRALQLTAERLLRIAPNDPTALNAQAWYLVTPRTPSLRDPARADELASRALAAAEVPAEVPWGCSSLRPDPRLLQAQILDTRAEARFQQRRFDEALDDQLRATELARELEIDDLPQFESRLQKIRRSAGRG